MIYKYALWPLIEQKIGGESVLKTSIWLMRISNPKRPVVILCYTDCNGPTLYSYAIPAC